MSMQKVAAVALALVAGAVLADEALKPLPGETAVAFQCRSAIIPEVRRCSQKCDEATTGQARLECVQSCTTRGLWSMGRCREAGGPVAQKPPAD